MKQKRIVPSAVAAALVVVAFASTPSSGAAAGVCGGTAPVIRTCSTGAHTGWIVEDGSHGVVPGPGYVGRLQSTITFAGGARTHTCDYPGMSCETTGQLPPAGVPFTHACASFERNSTTPGGSGAWACYLAGA